MQESSIKLKSCAKSIWLSYASILFSQNLYFGLALWCISLIYPISGLCGLFCVIAVNFIAYLISLDKTKIENGVYGFNAILIGVAIGMILPFNEMLFAILLSMSFFILMLYVFMEGLFKKYYLPVLSFPFLICLWIILLISQQSVAVLVFCLTFGHNMSIFYFSFLPLNSLI